MDLKKIYKTYMEGSGSEQEFQYKYYSNDKDTVAVYKREITKSITNDGNHDNNEAMHVNFYEDIIQRKIGYMASDISVKTEDERLNEYISDFNLETKQATKNMDSISAASISGISHRLVYTEDGIVKIKNIPGWQVVYSYKDDIFNPDYAYYYYTIIDLEGNKIYHCDVYGRNDVTYYIRSKEGAYTLIEEPQLHNFNQVPIFPFINNTSQIGDCKNVINIMNNYDFILSDTADELKSTRLTYLKIWGDLYTGQDSQGNDIPLVDWLTQGRAMIFGPSDEEGQKPGDAQFLNKTIDDGAVQNMLKLLRTHIYEGSGSLDLRELTDNNNQRVFSIQAALSRLENNAIVAENYAKMALRKQYNLLLYFLSETGKGQYDAKDVEIVFTRNFVQDNAALTETLLKAMNVMTTKRAYELSGLFDNPEQAA
ncbi:MAG: hypothetical protein B6229_03245, partial [Spirochaetaceae bacterium 4572_7]